MFLYAMDILKHYITLSFKFYMVLMVWLFWHKTHLVKVKTQNTSFVATNTARHYPEVSLRISSCAKLCRNIVSNKIYKLKTKRTFFY